ncbi:hypothetical protein M9Y10_015977 [Tritrichomonas musculus]|uniref:Uncharacterized protein n=1 Tax=Tritrichomonas musculus TaxID=1915356 RepID=A0ABR2I516_9EUKA
MFFWLVVLGINSQIYTHTYTPSKKYLLIPIQEDGSPAYQTKIYVDDKFEVVNDIRFAKDYVTYTFPLNVTNWIGKEVKLDIEIGNDNIENYVFWKGFIESDDYESKFDYDERYRPWYHFTPEYGWMNDPNGMFSTKDENGEITYHFHYQYNPYAAVWGNMHWGHAISKDLLHWKYLPHSLAPDDELGAIFSGSSIVDEENSAGLGKNTIFSYYTSTLPRQQQSMAYSKDNGFTWTKWESNPIIPNTEVDDFRDPKVCKIWLKGANKPIYIMTLAVGQHVEFWKSDNLLEWKYASSFGEEYGAHGGVWECPDLLYFEEYDKHVLLVNINPGGPFGGSSCQYFVGKFDGTTFTCDEDKSTIRWLEYGKDAYATVTYPKDQRIQGGSTSKTEYIGMTWMSNWQYAGVLPSQNYRSAMTIPRKISLVKLENGTYITSNLPIDDIFRIRGKTLLQDRFTLEEGVKDRWLTLAPEHCAGVEFNIEFTVTGNGRINFMFNNFHAQHYFVRFDPSTRTVTCQRDVSGTVSEEFVPADTSAQIPIAKTTYKWRIFFDSNSVEFFDEDGLITMTNLAYPTGVYTSIYISKDNVDDVLDIKSVRINKVQKVMKRKSEQDNDN